MGTIKVSEADLVALLGENGEHWIQGDWSDQQAMCLHGAIRRCQPQPGDAFIIERVAERHGWGTQWNDEPSTTWEMVRYRLAHVEVTDADLLDTFGPQWEAIVALVRRAATLTADEASCLVAARDAAGNAARDTARDAARAAAGYTARAAAGYAARAAAGDAAGYAAAAAAWALVVRDLIGQYGFTQQHYDTLTGPWRTTIGPIHPDDKEL
jgi:hypothetical protein